MTDLRRKLTALICAVCTAGIMIGCGNTQSDGNTTGGGTDNTPPPTPAYTIESAVPAVDANDDKYAAKNVVQKADSPLAGKTIYWLGSSVTYGQTSHQESMAEFMQALTGCTSKKDAVSGTTIFDDNQTDNTGVKSYTRRLVSSTVFNVNEHVDAFVCQISTNDAITNRVKNWGTIREDVPINAAGFIDKDQFNRKTTLGGVEFIIAYAIETWHCPVYFYSGSYFGDDGARKNSNPSGTNYGNLVSKVKEIAEKWTYEGYEVKVIDLCNDKEFNEQVTDEYYAWCMNDPVHPKRAGYLQWWTPYIENQLEIDFATK